MDLQDAITRMQHLVLSWDYFEMFDDSHKSDKGSESKRETKQRQARDLVAVPDTFDSVEHYISIFEPLLLEECSANIVRGCMEGEFAAVHKTVVAKADEVGEWTYGRMTLEPGVNEEFHTSSLVLLSKDHPDQYNARRELHVLGLAESREGAASVRIKFYLDLKAQAGNELGERRMRLMKEKLVYKSDWWICVLASLSTNFREWTALQSIRSLPFRNVLFSAKPATARASKLMEIAPSMRKKINSMYNKSQNDALQAGLDGTPVVLIQGPPGTGKTHAILGLLGIVLHAMQKGSLELIGDSDDDEEIQEDNITAENNLELWGETSPWILGRPMPRDSNVQCWDSAEDSDPNDDCYGLLDYDTPMVIGKQSRKPARVLVCAPSNSALDEIVHRIIHSGLMDNDGKFYHPAIVRVGVSVHHSVQSVHLEALMEGRLNSATGLSYFEKDRIKNEIIDEADIVASTLSYSGTNLFKKFGSTFDVVIVDEAAQAVETQLLIPLMNGARQVYMVGDPIQLPATVLSDRARNFEYNKSCFKRLMNAGYPVHMLNVQYRMNPAISAFPSREFYNGKLLDDDSVIESTKSEWHSYPGLGPLAFYHVEGKEEKLEGSMSTLNHAEVGLVIALFRELTSRFSSLRGGGRIAVISPYKAQVKEFRKVIRETFGEEIAQKVDVNSIDGFQGRQKDVTFFSAVRSKDAKHVGFVADEHRINVAITRARCSLIIVGDGTVLAGKDQRWRRLILSAKSHGCYYKSQRPFPTFVNKVIEGEIAPEIASEQERNSIERWSKGEDIDMKDELGNQHLNEGTADDGKELKGRGSGRGRGRGRGRRGRGTKKRRV